MNSGIIFFCAAVLIVGAIVFALISFSKKGPESLDKEKFRCDWLAIEKVLDRQEPTSYTAAVIKADTLLDQALKERGTAGRSLGERLKNTKPLWSDRNAIWSAHKLRNQVAHEVNAKINYTEARRALASFKQALKDAGAI